MIGKSFPNADFQRVAISFTPRADYGLKSSLICIFLLQQPRNRRQLNIARPLINRPNLTIPPILLRQPFPHKPHATHPLDRAPAYPTRHLTRKQLRHGRITDELLPGLLLPCRVKDEGAGGADLGPGLGELVLHALELADQLAELAPVVPHVPRCVLPRPEREARHLRRDADAALVQQTDGVLVTRTLGAEEGGGGQVDVVEGDDAGRRRFDPELLLFLGDGEAGGVFGQEEGRDAFVAGRGVEVGEDDEEAGFEAVGDPHLAAVDDVGAVGLLVGAGFQRKGV